MIRRVLIVVAICALPWAAQAQLPKPEFTIWGRLILPEGSFTRQGGIEVRLQLPSGLTVASIPTDDDGHFTFRKLISGSYIIFINLDGFSPVSETVTLRRLEDGGPTEPRVMLYLRRGEPGNSFERTGREGNERKSANGLSPAGTLDAGLFKKYSERAVHEYQQGLADRDNGNSEKALSHFARAVQLSPDFYEALLQLGVAQHQSGKNADAVKAFEKAAGIKPESAEPLTKLGGVLLDDARAFEQSGKAAEAAHTYERAADLLDRATRLEPDSTEAHYFLGSALFKTNELEDAEFNLKQAIDAASPLQDARLMLVNVFVKQRRYREALDQLASYLEAVPNSPQRKMVEDLQSRLRSALGP